MILNFLTLALAFTAVAPGQSHADGNELLTQCNNAVQILDGERKPNAPNDSPLAFGYCLGLMHGITETIRTYQVAYGHNEIACLPVNGLENGQAARVVTKFLRDHPERLHQPDALLAIVAIKEAFPCKGSSQ